MSTPSQSKFAFLDDFGSILPRSFTIMTAYIAGVIISLWIHPSPSLILLYVILASAYSLISYVFKYKGTILALLLSVFLFGMLMSILWSLPGKDDISNYAQSNRIEVTGICSSEAYKTSYGHVFTMEVQSARYRGRTKHAEGRLNTYVNLSEKPAIGDTVRVIGSLDEPDKPTNPGQFNYSEYQTHFRIFTVMKGYDSKIISTEHRMINNFANAAIYMKYKLLDSINKTVSKPYSDLLASMVFGIHAVSVSQDFEDYFRNSGTYHVLVVSGTQVGVLAALLIWLTRRRLLKPIISFPLLVIILIFYSSMVGNGASVIRAVIAGGVAALTVMLQRDTSRYSAVSIGALIILLINPTYLFDVGFLLTFAAVWGLIYLAPKFYNSLKFLPRWVAALLSASIAAQLATAPVIAYYFGTAAPMGILANIIAVPISELLVITVLLGALTGLFILPVSAAINWINYQIAVVLVACLKMFASIPGGHFNVALPPFYMIMLYYILLASYPLWIKRITPARAVIFVTGCAAFGILWIGTRPETPSKVIFLDIGDSEIAIIKMMDGTSVLIDNGLTKGPFMKSTKISRMILESALRYYNCTHLDIVISMDPDSIPLVSGITRDISVDKVFYLKNRDGLVPVGINRILNTGIRCENIENGDIINLLDKGEIKIYKPYDCAFAIFTCLDKNIVFGRQITDYEGTVISNLISTPPDILEVSAGDIDCNNNWIKPLRPSYIVAAESFSMVSRLNIKKMLTEGMPVMNTTELGAIEANIDSNGIRVQSMSEIK